MLWPSKLPMTMRSFPKIFPKADALILCSPVSDSPEPHKQHTFAWYDSKNIPTEIPFKNESKWHRHFAANVTITKTEC